MRCLQFLLLSVSSAVSCIAMAEPCDSLTNLTWLLGDWKNENEKQIVTEMWVQRSEETFEGRGTTISVLDRNKTTTESLRLVTMNNEIFYIAKVNHNALPISFKAGDCKDKEVKFENAGHDFPKTILYRMRGDNKLDVVVGDDSTNTFTIEFEKHE